MTTAPLLSEKLDDFWADLRKSVQGSVKTDNYSRVLYSTDASMYQVEPLGVFFPKQTEDIQAAMELAAQYQVPVLMRGAGTALAGQTVNEALVIEGQPICRGGLGKLLGMNPRIITNATWQRIDLRRRISGVTQILKENPKALACHEFFLGL